MTNFNETLIFNKKNNKTEMSLIKSSLIDSTYYNYNNNIDFIGNILSIVQEHEPEKLFDEKNVMVVDGPVIDKNLRKDTAEVMFELMGCTSLYICSQSILTLYDMEESTVLIVYYYDNKLYSVPIIEERIIDKSIQEIKLGNCKNKNIISGKIIEKINRSIEELDSTKKLYDLKTKSYNNSLLVNKTFGVDDIIFSEYMPNKLFDRNEDIFNNEPIIADPLCGGAKLSVVLNDYNCWITKDKFNENGRNIIDKKCFN